MGTPRALPGLSQLSVPIFATACLQMSLSLLPSFTRFSKKKLSSWDLWQTRSGDMRAEKVLASKLFTKSILYFF